MEYKLKPISKAGIVEANSKAERYYLLNEPEEAESICRDVLAVDPQDQHALRLLGLAITSQFTGSHLDRHAEVESIFQRLTSPYERSYYTGILLERRAKSQLQAGRPPHTLVVLLEKALRCYEEAEKIRPEGNDDAILRWNRCIRLLQSYPPAEWNREANVYDAGDDQPV